MKANGHYSEVEQPTVAWRTLGSGRLESERTTELHPSLNGTADKVGAYNLNPHGVNVSEGESKALAPQ